VSLIDFNIYEYKPNIKRILSENLDQYDYLATCFELSFINPDDKKYYTYELLTTLFIDYYEKNLKFTTEIDSEFIFESTSKFNKPRNSRTFSTEGGNIKLKNINTLIPFSLNDKTTIVLENIITTIITPKIISMKSFLVDNKINYDDKELENALLIIEERIKKIFQKDNLSNFFPFNIEIIDKYNQNFQLDNNLLKKSDSSKKLKI
jgi:hypothetical protein